MADAELDDQTLAPRAVPRQRRAIERRRAILDAALALLETTSLDALTTSLIATRAGVPVASVYAYFPNKMAVVAELAREAMEEVDARLTALLPASPDPAGIEQAVDRSIDAVLLFSSIRGNATLEPVLRESDDRMINNVAHNLAAARPDLPPLRIRAIAQTTVATFTAMQDCALAAEDPAYVTILVEEWRRIVTRYLLALGEET
jgi:AcrR family transcriptional regulator